MFNCGRRSDLYFWRDRSGNEIDIIHPAGEQLDAIEIKSGQTVNSRILESLKKWKSISGKRNGRNFLIIGSGDEYVREKIRIFPWNNIQKLAAKL